MRLLVHEDTNVGRNEKNWKGYQVSFFQISGALLTHS